MRHMQVVSMHSSDLLALHLHSAQPRCHLQITVWLDEARKHTDVLHLFVTEGEDITVPLSATGHGSVVTCPEIVGGIDFGPEFTGSPVSTLIPQACLLWMHCRPAQPPYELCCHQV